MTLGERLIEARGGRSLRVAAQTLGVDPMTLRAWEEGWRGKTPRPDKVDGLAAYLQVSRAEVLGLLGILRPDEVEALTMASSKPRNPTPRARRRSEPGAAPASATLSEDRGAYLSGPISVPDLALVA